MTFSEAAEVFELSESKLSVEIPSKVLFKRLGDAVKSALGTDFKFGSVEGVIGKDHLRILVNWATKGFMKNDRDWMPPGTKEKAELVRKGLQSVIGSVANVTNFGASDKALYYETEVRIPFDQIRFIFPSHTI